MNLLVIGQSVEDHIYEGGKITLKPGGIFYSTVALANLVSSEDTLYLCTSVQPEKEQLFESAFRKFNRSFFNYTSAIPVVHLTIHPDKERDERYENINNSLEINTDQLKNIEGIYLNMVSGSDIHLEKLEEIRNNFKGIIYIDIHTLSRGFDEKGKREFRLIPDAGRWIRQADILQVNESELFTLSDKKNADEIISDVLHSGPMLFILTMGSRGVRVYFIEEGETNSIYISAIKINALNKVGCGDVFGAVYFYYYVKSKNILEALKKANIAAGMTASYTEVSDFTRLNDDVLSRYY
jgi:sugar/nucleoside kinase (ribokinase family)